MNLASNHLNFFLHLSYCGISSTVNYFIVLNCSSLFFLMSLHLKTVWQAQSLLVFNYYFNNLRTI